MVAQPATVRATAKRQAPMYVFTVDEAEQGAGQHRRRVTSIAG
jgi:hypothetical protein